MVPAHPTRPRPSPFLSRAILIALAVLVPGVSVGPVSGAGALPTLPRPPEQPAHGPGGAATAFEGVSATRVGRPPTGYWLFEPTDLRLDAPQPPATIRLPVVVFLHGFTALDPMAYRAWIDHIVRRGAIVVYPDYQTINPFATDWDLFLPNTVNAVRAALAQLEAGGRAAPDRSRVAAVGHSLGGVLATGYAAVAGAEGLPEPAVLMPVQPGGCDGCGRLPSGQGVPLSDLEQIEPSTRALIVVGEDDDLVGDGAAKRIWAGMTNVPLEQRDYVALPSDHRGYPPLRATHLMAQTAGFNGREDALDWYGTWKLLDLLMECAFTGELCDAALGDTPEQRFMGVWSDGEQVTEARIADDPGAPG